VKMLDLSRVPVLLEGRYISVPSGRWEVAEACSGIRYLTSSVTVGFLYAGLTYRSWIRRIAFLLASAVVPIFANGFRVYGIILLAYLSSNRIAAGVDHLIYGWIFFTIVMISLLWVGSWWREKPERGTVTLPDATPNSRDSSAQGHFAGEILRASAKRTALFSALFFLVLGLGPLAAKLIWKPVGELPPLRLAAPAASRPWRTSSEEVYGWKPSFATPNAELIQSYESKEHIVELYVAYYGPGRPDAKLVSSTNSLFDGKFWSRTGEDETAVTFDGRSFYVHEVFIRSAQESLTVWNWYWVDEKFTSNEYFTKYLLAKADLLRSHQAAAAIALATADHSDPQRAAEVLKEFLNHVALRDCLH
jgi:EpsI family protein